jgi:hypothetical protein
LLQLQQIVQEGRIEWFSLDQMVDLEVKLNSGHKVSKGYTIKMVIQP